MEVHWVQHALQPLLHHGMLCLLYLTLCFLLFGGDRWQLLMGQLRNSIVIYGASTTRQCLNALPDMALQSRSDCDFDSTRTGRCGSDRT